MAKIDVKAIFKRIFPNIRFIIRPIINEDFDDSLSSSSQEYPDMEPAEYLYFVLRALEHDLQKAKRKLSIAIKLHKLGELSIEEVQDHEMNVYDLEQEIQDVTSRINRY